MTTNKIALNEDKPDKSGKVARSSPQIHTSEGGRMMLHVPQQETRESSSPKSTPYRYKRPSRTLNEHEYYNNLQHIITRDYFPNVRKIQQRIDELDQIDENINESQREADKMSLSQFQQKYTSEDNTSFAKLVEAEVAKKRKLLKNQLPPGSQKKQLKNDGERDASSGPKMKFIDNRETNLDTWKYNPKNALMNNPSGCYNDAEKIKTGQVSPENTQMTMDISSNEQRTRQQIVDALHRDSRPQINGYNVVTKNDFNIPEVSKREKLLHSLIEEKKIRRVEKPKTHKVLTPAASRMLQNSTGLGRSFSFNVTPRRTPK